MWPRPKRGGESRNKREKKRQGERRETTQRQTSSCSGQARLSGAGRDGFFFLFNFFIFIFSAGEVARRRASLVPNSGAGPRYRATSERHTHTGLDKAGVC